MPAAGWALIIGIVLTTIGNARKSTFIIILGTLIIVGAIFAIAPGFIEATAEFFRNLGEAGEVFVNEL